MQITAKTYFYSMITVFILLFVGVQPIMADEKADIYSGYYSRDREDGKAAEIAGLSKYMKFYPDNWVVMLYIPYEYSQTLNPEIISTALQEIKSQTKTKSYFKAKFGDLSELSVAHVEVFGPLENGQLEFECDGTAPCRAQFSGDKMELRKAGMISDHMIDYNRVIP